MDRRDGSNGGNGWNGWWVKRQADHGFGVLTEIDVKVRMKKKLDLEMPAYRIFGACNPKMAHQAIGIEPRVGAMLPCNVMFREVEGGVEVSASVVTRPRTALR